MPVDINPSASALRGSGDDIDLRSKMKELKRELKEFEHTFQQQEGRKPDKSDIASNRDIAKKYKLYAKVKSQIENQQPEKDSRENFVTEIPKVENKVVEVKVLPPAPAEEFTNVEPFSTVQESNNNSNISLGRGSKASKLNDTVEFEAPIVESVVPLKTNSTWAEYSDHLPANFKLKEEKNEFLDSGSDFTRPSLPERSHLQKSTDIPAVIDVHTETTYVEAINSSSGGLNAFNEFMARKKQIEKLTAESVNSLEETSSSPSPRVTESDSRSQPTKKVIIARQQSNDALQIASKNDQVDETDSEGESESTPGILNRRKSELPPVEQQTEILNITAKTVVIASSKPKKPPTPPRTEEKIKSEVARREFTDESPSTSNTQIEMITQNNKISEPEISAKIEVISRKEEPKPKPTSPPELPARRPSDALSPSATFEQINQPAEDKKFEVHLQSPILNDDENDDVDDKNAILPSDTKTSPFSNAMKQQVLLQNPKLFKRVPKDCVLRCKVYRKKLLIDKSHPTYFLYNEADDQFLLAARKRKKTKSVNFIISTNPEELTKDSKYYVAKLSANFQRTQFILYDARGYNRHAPGKGLKEVSAVSYSKTMLPREIQVAIPSVVVDEEESNTHTKDIIEDIRLRNTEKLLFLRNKPPRWNEATQTHCLNFGGRVTMPSIKNFQLIGDDDENYIMMQFGRCGPDLFSIDVRYPLTPMEAFGIALTTFDAYDSA